MTENILTLKHIENLLASLTSNDIEEHAELSASSSHRWSLCAGSVAAEKGLSDTKSIYAKEGQLAHKIAEQIFHNPNYTNNDVPFEMMEHATTYVNHLNSIMPDEILLESELLLPKTHYYIEKRVEFDQIYKGGFGTADAIVINYTLYGVELHIIDFKYGKGVKVDAFENTQLILYALGAINTLKTEINDYIDKIHLEIVQPRMNHKSKWTITYEELKVWEGYLKAKAEAALQPNASRIASDIACQWCKAFPTCKAPYELIDNLTLDENDLTEDQIRQILDNSRLIVKFVNAVEEKVYNSLLAGQIFKGYKLIEGKQVRKLKDDSEEKIINILGSEAYETKLIGITKLEKLLGKELLNSLTYYSPCKPVLVKEDDRRNAIVLEELNYDAA